MHLIYICKFLQEHGTHVFTLDGDVFPRHRPNGPDEDDVNPRCQLREMTLLPDQGEILLVGRRPAGRTFPVVSATSPPATAEEEDLEESEPDDHMVNHWESDDDGVSMPEGCLST